MSTYSRRIENGSVYVKTKLNYPKKIPRNSFPKNRECKSRRLMTEINNVSETIRQVRKSV